MFFNISLPDLSKSSDKQNVEAIRGYLATLNDQLRYMMLNIDEENLSDDLVNVIKTAYLLTTQWRLGEYLNGQMLGEGTITPDKIAVDSNSRTNLAGNPNGINVSYGVNISGENGSALLYVNDLGMLTLKQSNNSLPFSLVLSYENEEYNLTLYNQAGDAVGKIPIQLN